MDRERDSKDIDKEYADLCIKFGDISQKLQHLDDEETQAQEKLSEEKGRISLIYADLRKGMRTELQNIRNRWRELQVEVQSRLPQG